jgi:hypothetical protein
LKPSDQDRLLGVDVSDSGVITDEIIRAELGEDSVVDRATRAWLKALVDDWLFDLTGAVPRWDFRFEARPALLRWARIAGTGEPRRSRQLEFRLAFAAARVPRPAA